MSDAHPDHTHTHGTGSGARQQTPARAEPDVETSTPERDLDLFEDQERAGQRAGSFSSPSNHLDHVNLDTQAHRPAATSSFGAPRLDDAELHRKVGVCSEVLGVVAQAIAGNGNPGMNSQAWLALLMEGSPTAFAPLFSGIPVRPDGHLDAAAIAENVRHRPPTEHRRLVNEGLLDLMDRALSRCTDELPEPVADRVLVDVAGYRKRLGL